jgi:hypothetical protein
MIASSIQSYDTRQLPQRQPYSVSMSKVQSAYINTPGVPPTKTTRSIIPQARIPSFSLPQISKVQVSKTFTLESPAPQFPAPTISVPKISAPTISVRKISAPTISVPTISVSKLPVSKLPQLPRVIPQIFKPSEEKIQSLYALNQVEYINAPIVPYSSTVPLPTIKNPPPQSTLPVFVYRQDTAGNLTRYLVAEDDNRDADPDFGIEQEWLLFQRQGDEYDRLPEYVPDQERAVLEQYNVPSNSSLNQGVAWGPLPYPNFVTTPGDDEYKQLLEYQKTQEDEDD